MRAGLHAVHGGRFVGFVADDEDADAGKFRRQFADQRRALLLQEGNAEQHDMRLEPADALFIGLFGARQFVGFDFIMQHELQRGAGDLVIVDDEHAPLVDSFRCFDADLHFCLLSLRTCSAVRPIRAASNFRSVTRGAERVHKNRRGEDECQECASGLQSLSDFEQTPDSRAAAVGFKTPGGIQEVGAFQKLNHQLKATGTAGC